MSPFIRLTHIVRYGETFLLYYGGSLTFYPAIFEWKEDHFERWPQTKSSEFIGHLGEGESAHCDTLDQLCKQNGWQHIRPEFNYDEALGRLCYRHEWNGVKARIEWDRTPLGGLTVRVVPEKPQDAFTPVVLEYPGEPYDFHLSDIQQHQGPPRQNAYPK